MRNIYQGLEVEPPMPVTIERIHLRGKFISETQFAFIPEYWEETLRPYKKAKWSHEKADLSGSIPCVPTPHAYTLKQGAFLVFPEFKTNGGFYAAHLYMIAKELSDLLRKVVYQRTEGTFTEEGLEIRPSEAVDGIKTKLFLKYRGPKSGDAPYHAILSY